MVGDAVTVQIGQRVVGQPVAVEVQADRVEPAVAVEVEIRSAVPDRRCAVTGAQAILHASATRPGRYWFPRAFHQDSSSAVASSWVSGPRSSRNSLR